MAIKSFMTRNKKTTETIDSDDVDYVKQGKYQLQTKDFPGADIVVPQIMMIIMLNYPGKNN